MKVLINIRNRADVPDAVGQAIRRRIVDMGSSDVRSVRVGKTVELELDIGDDAALMDRAKKLCQELLVNELTEEYDLKVTD
jgi:phosphoribosylformylglycinamidine synthase subunit PurS